MIPNLQVAVDRTSPHGHVLGIDVIPAQPPTGVSTIQGNFLSPFIQEEVKKYLSAAQQGKHKHPSSRPELKHGILIEIERDPSTHSYLEQEKQSGVLAPQIFHDTVKNGSHEGGVDIGGGERTVDVVLSDMSAPWEQTEGFWKRSLSDPYYRMMNTSGIKFRDHAGSMDLCEAAMKFTFDTLRPNGHLICKFYQGTEDKALENRLKMLFAKVHRDKPESSRKESKEAYFVALRRKAGVRRVDVFRQIPS
ncbi:MAG: hypothetical protein Q9197_003783 [Variospora fuerteventurae]